MSNEMSISAIIGQLNEERDLNARTAKSAPDSKTWPAAVAACEAAIKILAALEREGCSDFEQVLDVFQDYKSLGKQYAKLQKQFEVAGKPVYRDSVWHCPNCNRRIHPRHSYCHCCGKKLGWGR